MKARSVIEVLVVFALIWLALALVSLSPLGVWERQIFGRYSIIEYILIIGLTLLFLAVTRRNLAAYGISFRNLGYHLNIALTAFLPVALGFLPVAFIGNNHKTWWGSLIMAGVNIAVLFLLAWMLRRKPTRNESGLVVSALLFLTVSNLAQRPSLENPAIGFIFYIFILGFGEELLFRGYIQSRLNEAWGGPLNSSGFPGAGDWSLPP